MNPLLECASEGAECLRCKLPDEIRLEIWCELVIELDYVDIRFVVRPYYRPNKDNC